MLSLGIASMLFTSIFLWIARDRVLPKFRMAVMVSATVTSIAAYHYFRMFDSFNEAYTVGGTAQAGFDGYKLERFRRFYKDGEQVKKDKWVVTYKPVTEYIRRGTNRDPNAKMPELKEPHGPKAPTDDTFKMEQ